jgi:hypothetical protein
MTPPRSTEELDTLSPADRLRAHAMADRVIEIIEERHRVTFSQIAETSRAQKQSLDRREKIVHGAALTVLAAIIAAAFSLIGEILKLVFTMLKGQ